MSNQAKYNFEKAKQQYTRAWWQSKVNPTPWTITTEIFMGDDLDDAQQKMNQEATA